MVATTDVALLKMSKDDFDKTMGPLAKYLTDKARSNYGLTGPATKDIKLSDLKIVRSQFPPVTSPFAVYTPPYIYCERWPAASYKLSYDTPTELLCRQLFFSSKAFDDGLQI